MVQDAGADDQIEAAPKRGGLLDRQLPRFEIRQVVLPLQLRRVIEAGRADVNADDAGVGAAERVLRGLPGSTAGNQDIEVGTIRSVGPQQVILGAMAILVPPLVAGAIEIGHRRRIRVVGIEVADGIGIHLGYASVPEALGGVKHRGCRGRRRSCRTTASLRSEPRVRD